MSAMFDRTLTIQAPLHLVWQEAYKFAHRGKLVIERAEQLLVATQLEFGYVYWLEANPDGSTNLRAVIDSAAQVEEKLSTTPNVPAALATFSSEAQSTGNELYRVALGAFFQVGSPDVYGETALTEIKKKAEKEAKKSNWQPRFVPAPVSAADLSTGMPPVALEPTAFIPPTPLGNPPFAPLALIGMALLFNFGAAGVLAGLNWKRFGKPERIWPTILLSLTSIIAFMAAMYVWPVFEAIVDETSYAIHGALGALLCFWQGPYYNRWVATYGKAKTGWKGFLTGLGVGIGIILLAFLTGLVMTVLQEFFATGL